MPAMTLDAQMACAALSKQGLDQCRSSKQPAYISLEHTACAVVTSKPVSSPLTVPTFITPDFAELQLPKAKQIESVTSRPCSSVPAARSRPSVGKNAQCLIYGRQLQKLGSKTATILRREQDGILEDVLLSTVRSKNGDVHSDVRVGHSDIALIIMRKNKHVVVMRPSGEVAAILASGDKQVVNGVLVRARKHSRQVHQALGAVATIEAGELHCDSDESMKDGNDRVSTRCPSFDEDGEVSSEISSD